MSWNLRLSDSRLKLMPLSVMVPYLLFSLIMEKAWKPPESVMMGFCQACHLMEAAEGLDGGGAGDAA